MPDFTMADIIAAQGGGGPVYEGGPTGNVTPADLLSYFNRLGQHGAQADVNLTQGIKDALTGAVLAPGRAATGAYNVTPEVPGQYSDVDEARRQLNEAHAGRSVFDLASLMIGAPGGSGGVGSGVRSQLGEVPSFTERMDTLKDAAFQRAQRGTATGDYGLGTARRTEPAPPKGSMEDASDRLMSSLRDTQRQLQEYKNPPAQPLLAPGETDVSFYSGGNKQAGGLLAAVKVGDQVFTGPVHSDALQAAAAARGMDPSELFRMAAKRGNEGMTGFVTSDGRFVDRAEALNIAREAGQLGRTYPNQPELLAQDLKPSTEMTPIGEQYVLPGAERASEATMAQRAADAPLKAEVPQKPPGGLFSDEGNQGSLFSGGNKRAGTLLALARGDEGAGPISGMGGVYRPPPIVQTVDKPVRNAVPGIYGDPRDIAAQALGVVAPEHPALKQLFNVNRRDLYDIAMSRKGNVDPYTLLPGWKEGATGSYAADAIMNPRNAQRLQDILAESMKIPELREGMVPWYVMDPAYQNLVKQFGPDVAKQVYTPGNILTSMASPGSPVDKELIRGTSASMMANLGRFDEFAKYGGMQGKRGAPPEMADVPGHIYHRTSQVGPMQHYVDTGEIGLQSPKVPLYIGASGVPETGFQTGLPIPDVHFTGGLGMFDVRKGKGFRSSMVMPEFQGAGPWYAENVAKPVGLEPVYAQALQWGALAPHTGVDTAIGAGKLELLAKSVWERAQRLGVDPHELLNRVLARQAHAALPVAGAAGAAAAAMREDQ